MVFALWTLFAFAVLLCLFCLYLWAIAPARKPYPAGLQKGVLYAHRGLHDGNHTVYENSLKAFALAVEHGYGMEMDLQTTKDGKVVIHHDLNTRRVCGKDAVIEQTAYADLPRLPDGEPIPLFSDLLTLVAGKTPLIIELKHHNEYRRTVRETLGLLEHYEGVYCLESFHPMILQYLRGLAPQLLRGQLSSGGLSKEIKPVQAFLLKHLLMNRFSRPHFIAYDFSNSRTPSLWLNRLLFRPLLVAWTIRSQRDLDAALKRYDTAIFEGFIPNSNP